MLDKRKPHSSPLFYLFLTEIAISSSWVKSVDEYAGSGSVRELLANNSSSTYKDGLTYCWDALSIWLQSRVEAAYWLGVQRLFEWHPKSIWAHSSWFSCFNYFVYWSSDCIHHLFSSCFLSIFSYQAWNCSSALANLVVGYVLVIMLCGLLCSFPTYGANVGARPIRV